MDKVEKTYIKSLIGIVKIEGTKKGIEQVTILDNSEAYRELLEQEIPCSLKECVIQLKEYFNNERASFNLTVNPKGTAFQLKVWKELLKIPYGKTISYLQQSKNLGNIKAIRAVASANGKNPLSIIVPCHRVIGSDGSLTGYAGGLWRKEWLLKHENALLQQTLF